MTSPRRINRIRGLIARGARGERDSEIDGVNVDLACVVNVNVARR